MRGAAGLLLVLLLLGAPAGAAGPSFGLPVDCTPGRDCWVQNYLDVDPGPDTADYACGRAAYDGHTGTDFALRDRAAMRAGVPVIASAAGRVLRTRDGEADFAFKGDRNAVKGRECGNAVVIDHGGGWETQYCHLKRGSLAVRPGQQVAAGARLGAVGQSGLAEFPHVHLTIRHAGKVVEPFRGLSGAPACGLGPEPLWSPAILPALAYGPALFAAGITDSEPRVEEIEEGQHRQPTLARSARLLIVWMRAMGVAPGDRIDFALVDPQGRALLAKDATEERHRARSFRYVGLRRPAAGWPAGSYRATITLSRSAGPGAGTWTLPVEVTLR
ncbi:MAG: M23 family metallopeptidase [Thalassobaculales bacterium]